MAPVSVTFTEGIYNTTGYIYKNGPLTITNLDPSKKDLRIITTSSLFGCTDTTNFIPIKINGPKAGFKIIESSPCYEHPVILQDTSIAGAGPTNKNMAMEFLVIMDMLPKPRVVLNPTYIVIPANTKFN